MSAAPPESAFWLWPDWSGGDNLRDPGTEPFWMRPPRCPSPDSEIGAAVLRTDPGHVCGPFVTLWTGWRYCVECEQGEYLPD